MTDRDPSCYEHNEVARRIAASVALATVRGMSLSDSIDLPEEIHGLGKVVAREYSHRRRRVGNLKTFSLVVAFAVKVAWYSVHRGATWFSEAIERGVVGDNDYTRTLLSAEGYGAKQGWAWTLFNTSASEIETVRTLAHPDLLGDDFPSSEQLLDVIGLYWMFRASESELETRIDLLAEAFIAFELANGLMMWDAGAEAGKEEGEVEASARAGLAARKAIAFAGAAGRIANDPRTPAKSEVRAKWVEWQSRKYLYSSQAEFARQMLKDLPVLTSQAVIEGWCRDWKNDLPNTSQPAG